MTKKNQYSYVLLSCLFLTSCSESPKTISAYQYLTMIKNQAIPPIEVMKVPTLLANYSYQLSTQRSPFTAVNTQVFTEPRQQQTLEKYALETLRLVGVIKTTAISWALILIPNGHIERATIGDYIGNQQSKIQAIDNEKITIAHRANKTATYLYTQSVL